MSGFVIFYRIIQTLTSAVSSTNLRVDTHLCKLRCFLHLKVTIPDICFCSVGTTLKSNMTAS